MTGYKNLMNAVRAAFTPEAVEAWERLNGSETLWTGTVLGISLILLVHGSGRAVEEGACPDCSGTGCTSCAGSGWLAIPGWWVEIRTPRASWGSVRSGSGELSHLFSVPAADRARADREKEYPFRPSLLARFSRERNRREWEEWAEAGARLWHLTHDRVDARLRAESRGEPAVAQELRECNACGYTASPDEFHNGGHECPWCGNS